MSPQNRRNLAGAVLVGVFMFMSIIMFWQHPEIYWVWLTVTLLGTIFVLGVVQVARRVENWINGGSAD